METDILKRILLDNPTIVNILAKNNLIDNVNFTINADFDFMLEKISISNTIRKIREIIFMSWLRSQIYFSNKNSMYNIIYKKISGPNKKHEDITCRIKSNINFITKQNFLVDNFVIDNLKSKLKVKTNLTKQFVLLSNLINEYKCKNNKEFIIDFVCNEILFRTCFNLTYNLYLGKSFEEFKAFMKRAQFYNNIYDSNFPYDKMNLSDVKFQ